jgi:hypothetical protein
MLSALAATPGGLKAYFMAERVHIQMYHYSVAGLFCVQHGFVNISVRTKKATFLQGCQH